MLKPSKLVGWSQQQPSSLPSVYHHHQQQQQTSHQLKQQHTEPWMTQSPCTTATTTASIISTPSNNTSPKDPATNTSLDSGVAGLRDTPVHTPGPTHHNNNNNMPGPKSTNNSEDYDVPKFIVDQTTRTTYMKGRFLGKGGFARVHELTDLTTNVTYAGKIIPKSRITKPHHKEKIAREIEVHRQLHHQHVVRFHHYFEDDSNVYIILENCSMRSLVHVVKYRRTLTEPEVRYYIRQLAEGVAYIHGVGIIHRDLKLGNMFLSHDMKVKIGDFGLATRTADTRQVTICGTPNYIAPEVLNRFGHYYQADIWAIGCIMYALLVGQPPFETETLKETYSRITNNQYVIPPLVSAHGRALITDLLHPEPKSRPTVHELLQHDFFTKGFIPPTLPTTACTQLPKLGLDSIGKSVSMPEHTNQQQHSQVISQDIKKITTSVSTLRLPNLKPQQDKISILTDNLSHQIPAISNNNRNTNNNNNLMNNNNNIHSPPSPTSQQPPKAQVHLTVQQRLNQQNSQQRQPTQSLVSSAATTTTSASAMVSQAATVSQAKESGRRKDGMRLFEKLTSVIYPAPDAKGTTCLGGLVGGRRRDITSGTLYNLLAACLDSMPDGVNSNPPCLSGCPLFISKWIDYSNKYGFGYQLSDHSVGVFFNDLTRINLSPDKSRVEFHDCSGRLSVESSSSLPVWLQERYQLLLYFAAYMDENLTEAGETALPPSSSRSSSSISTSSSNNSSTSSAGSTGGGTTSNNGAGSSKSSGSGGTPTVPYIRRWDRTPKSIIMQLSNGTFQINFFKDHTKIVVSGGDDASLLFISSERVSSSYSLAHVASSGCDAVIRERLVYALSCLRQYAELDGEEV